MASHNGLTVERVSLARAQLLQKLLQERGLGRVQKEMRGGGATQMPAINVAQRSGSLPLSFAQLRLWFLHRLQPDNAAYNMPVAVHLTNLHVAAMEASLSEVVRRHESLRTVFRPTPRGEPVQVILAAAPVRLPEIDLSGLPGEMRRAEASCRSKEEASHPFDLEEGPLLRVSLLRLSATEHIFLGTLHHIVSDGWSLRVFETEMTALYEAYRAENPSPLTEPSLQYADFAVWQRQWLQGEVLEAQLAYWKRQLRDLPPSLPLPTARPGRATSRSRGAEQRLRLSAEETVSLRALSRSEGCTPFMVLLAGLQALLCRYTGQADFCIGTPIAGRNRVEIEELIGCFLNTLALRANLTGNPSFRDLLAQVRETSLGAYAHLDLPFEKVIQEIQPERDLQRTPIFQVLFNMFDLAPGNTAVRSQKSPLKSEQSEEQTFGTGVKLDLSVYAEEREGEIEIRLEYDADLFDQAQRTAMAEHLRELLAGALAEPDRRISDLVLSTPGRRARPVLHRTGEVERWSESSIGERFRRSARAHPKALAISTADHRWTYEQLDRLSDRVALELAQLGDSPRVALLLAQGAPRILAVLAALKAGRAYVALDPGHPEARLAAILRDAEAGVILTENSQVGLALRLAGTVFPIDFAEGADGGMARATELPWVAPETPAYILYTSGSSGEPKGVVQSHRNVLHHIQTYSKALRIAPTDRLSLLSSYTFDAAVMDIFGALLNGATLLPFDIRQQGTAVLGRWMIDERVTIFHSTPTLFRRFLEDLEEEVFPEVRVVVLGGEKCLLRDFEEFRAHFPSESLFVNGLGPTESTLALQFFAGAGTVLDRETVPVGYAVEDTEVFLRNATGEQAAVYGIGEIEIRSPHLALGYWRRPDLTAVVFLDDPKGGERRVYRTGDLGRWLPDGSLEFVGRSDSQVKVRGHRIELGEVETALSTLPGVREAVVVAHEDPRTGEPRLAAYILAPGGQGADPLWLRRTLQQWLPDPMIPADFVMVEAWPLTSTGKVDRRALPAPRPIQGALEAGTREPKTPLEELLCVLWAEILGLERVGVNDDFFVLGGHSLMATQLLSRIRQVVSVELPLRTVFEAPTAAAMTERLEQALRTGESGPRLPIVPLPRDRPLPLSFAQQRFWFLEQLQPGTAAYNLPAAVLLSGTLEIPVLAAAFAEVARRHEVLRATFEVVDGAPVQRIAPAGPVPLPVVDLSWLPPASRRTEALEQTREEAKRPFDLEQGPLFRAELLRLGDREHALLVSFHHALTDGWSQGIFWRELSVLYEALTRGLPSPLADLPLQYADFAHWQRGWLAGEILEGQLAYWREQLLDVPPHLDLPFDRPRPALSSMRGGTRPLDLSLSLSGRIRELGRRTGTTPFMILLAALQAVVARHTATEDVCVGTPIAGRTRVELEALIGVFVNTLVMRGDLAGDPSFLELLWRTREVALQAHAHQDLPFERLVEELQPERSLNVSPLFQVMLAFQNVRHASPPSPPDLELGILPIATDTVKFDLSLTVNDAEGFTGTAEYAAELFDATTIDRLLGHLATLLGGGISNPDQRLSELPLLRPAERHQLLVEWGDTAATDPRENLGLHQLILAQAESTPEAVAVIYGPERLTYGQLDALSARLAARLAGAGVGLGVFVPVLLETGVELVVALLGVLRAGAAFVPLDPAGPAARLEAILEELHNLSGGIVLGNRETLAALALVGSSQRHLLQVDGDPEPAPPYSVPAAVVPPEAPIYAIYTSGSTGRPKGVVVPHRGVVNRFLWMDRFFGSAAESVLQTTRHVYDSAVWQLFWPLTRGGATVLTDPGRSADPFYLCDLIESHGVTLTDFVPSVFNLLVQQLGDRAETAARLASLRALIVGGEEMNRVAAGSFLDLFPDVLLVNLYGPTETTIGCIYHGVAAGDGVWARVPIGRPISNVHPVILSPWGSPVPVGVPGELCLSGRCLGLGYLEDGERTAGAFVPNPVPEIPYDRLYRTGDLARQLPDGKIDFLGRIDHQIKIRGLRIELGEIETALRRHPRVAEAVVLVWPEGSEAQDRSLAACFTASPGGAPSGEDLGMFLREYLPASMVPALFVGMDSLPLTPGGKVDRRALVAILGEHWRARTEEAGPALRTPFEEILAGLWAEVLRIDRVRPDDEFFALGGHSLLATQVVSRIRQAFDVELPIRALFEAPTLAGLARRIEKSIGSGVPAAPPIRPVPRDRVLPLSFAQQRLWFLDRLTPGAALYHLFTPFLLEGDFDPGAFVQSLREVVRRHEALRTTFPEVEGEPIQVVASAATAPLPLVDLQGLPEEAGDAEILLRIGLEARRPFDLAHGPLLRVLLLRLAPDRHAVLFSVHHIVCDGWSLGLLTRELTALYSSFSRGEPSPLPEPQLQYADYAVWQRKWLQAEVLERELDYWRRQLAGTPPVLELPSDRPRPAVQSFRGERLAVAFPASLASDLGLLARREKSTLFMVLLAGLDALLFLYTKQERILVGTPIANRNRVEIEDIIGNFANTLVLGVALKGGLSFLGLLARVRESALGAYAHQDFPFELLVEALSPRRDLSYNPIFQVLFGLHNLPLAQEWATDLSRRPLAEDSAVARFDLALDLNETPAGGVQGALEYATDLFDTSTALRISGHLRVLLESAISHPDLCIGELSLLTEAERQQLLVDWSGTCGDFSSGRCLHELFEVWAQCTPDAVALVGMGQRLTYQELDRRAHHLAHQLRRLGAGPDIVVGLYLERSPDLVVALLGILKAGAAYLPLDPDYPRQRLARLLDASGAPLLVTRASLAGELPEHCSRVLDLDAGPCPGEAEGDLEPLALPDNLAYVIFTSGSTGSPKGVQVTHRSAVHLMETSRPLFELGPDDVWTVVHSFAFDFSVWEIWGALAQGGRLLVVPAEVTRSPVDFAELILTEGVTILSQTPSALRQLVEEGGPVARQALRAPRLIVCGGEALPTELVPPLLEREARVWNFYGPTESTVWAAAGPVWSVASGGTVPLGRPLPDNQLFILDAGGQPLPVGVAGELCIAGAGLARGYFRAPGPTAEKFIPHPFGERGGERLYRTGDLVRRRGDGALEFLGRIDQQVKVRGYRIEPEEIESVLAEHPAVSQVVVTAGEISPGERDLIACLVPAEPIPPAVEDLRSFAASHLPAYMVPSIFVVLDHLPLTPNGKVDRRALSQLRPAQEQRLLTRTAHIPPRDELELRLVRIWEDLLRGRRVGVTDDFFNLGGHSMLAVRLLSRVRAELGQDLPLSILFQHSTVEQLATVLRRSASMPARQVLVEIQSGHARKPFFLVHPVGGNTLCYLDLARCLGSEQPVYGLQTPDVDPPIGIEGLALRYLEAARSIQPEGPYAFGGWSMGGLIAFEMARRLEEIGEEVAPLVLIDVDSPRAGGLPTLDPVTLFAHDLARSAGLDPVFPSALPDEGPEERLFHLYKTALTAGLLPPELELSEIQTLFSLFRSNAEAMHGYAGGGYSGEVILFRAGSAVKDDPSRGWDSFAGHLEVRALPGDHYSILRRPAVEILARELSHLLGSRR